MTKKKSAPKKSKANKKAAPKAERKVRNRIARQESLPGMQDRRIKVLEDLALDYADLRDQRIALGIDEGTVKQRLLEAMHREKKSEYHRANIHITVKPEGEKLKVRIKDEASPDAAIEVPETAAPEVEVEAIEEAS